MIRYILLYTSLAFSMMNAQASVSVDWFTLGTVEDSGGNLPAGSLAYLIWSGPDNMIDSLDDNNPLLATGDDIILATHNLVVPGFITAPTANQMGENFSLPDDSFVGGFVYVRIFNSGSPTVGTGYGDSALSPTLLDQDPSVGNSPGPQPFDISGGVGSTFVLNNTVVPEPSSLALIVLGAGWLVSRKRRV